MVVPPRYGYVDLFLHENEFEISTKKPTRCRRYPPVIQHSYWKWPIYRWFTYENCWFLWWFSICEITRVYLHFSWLNPIHPIHHNKNHITPHEISLNFITAIPLPGHLRGSGTFTSSAQLLYRLEPHLSTLVSLGVTILWNRWVEKTFMFVGFWGIYYVLLYYSINYLLLFIIYIWI